MVRVAMRAALYHRVSKLDQDAELAREELRKAARGLRARVVLDVEEKGTGTRNDRPGLQRVLAAARKNQVDVVIVWKIDRWGRSVIDLLENVRALVEGAGVRFYCCSQGLDLKPGGDAVSKLLLTMLGGVAEFESSLISERTKLGLARARRNGKRIGHPPVPRPELEAVRDAWREREQRWPKPTRAQMARELGVSEHALREVLQLATCGERRHDYTEQRCGRAGGACRKGCGATVCSWHHDEHRCRAPRPGRRGDKGTVRAETSSATRSSSRSPLGEKGTPK